jgi:YggT family protein
MNGGNLLADYELFVRGVRVALLYAAVVLAVVAAIDWAVRTRRISPFNRISRFFRTSIDPLLAPMERVIVRAGGVPSAAAWWALVAFVVFGILLIYILLFLGDLLTQVLFAVQQPSEAWRYAVHWVFSLLLIALIVRVLSSWLPISPYSRWVRWSYVLTDWMVIPVQRVIPRIGMFDITPIVLWFLLQLAEKVILSF